jgi:transaldolase
MLRQAYDLAALSPNVMVKVPGTREGTPVLRELTRRGIATNCTLAYTVPQFVAVAEQVQAGLREARTNDVDLTGWRSVVTHMSARWEDARSERAAPLRNRMLAAGPTGLSLARLERPRAGARGRPRCLRITRNLPA